MNPAIDQTIYFIKVKSTNIKDLIEQMKLGADNIEAIQEENYRIYEATENLYKIIKAELQCE